jgi:hypothetical protein
VLTLAGWAEALTWIAAALVTVAGTVNLTAVGLYGDYWDAPAGSLAEAEAWDAYSARTDPAAAAFVFGLFVNVAVVVLLMVLWFRVLQQAKRAGAEMGLGPGWAIGGWFIPCAGIVFPALVGANVRRLAAWQGNPPIARAWKTSFPPAAILVIVAFAGATVLNLVSGSFEPTDRMSAMGRETLSSLVYYAWAIGLVAAAVLTRRTRHALRGSPLVNPF